MKHPKSYDSTPETRKRMSKVKLKGGKAETLLAKYPNIVEDIISGNDNVDTSYLKGIGDKTYDSIKKKVIDNYVISDILTLLQPLGVTYAKIKKLLSNEPNPTLLKEKLLSNPYIMLNIRGFGFKTVDQLALKLKPKCEKTGFCTEKKTCGRKPRKDEK